MIPIKYNMRYLINRKVSTIMTALTFALVVAVFIMMMAMSRGIERALTTAGDPLNVLVMRPGVQSEGQSQVSIENFNIIRNWPGIAKDAQGQELAVPETEMLVNRPRKSDGKMSNLMIRGVQAQSFKIRPEVKIVEGRNFTPGKREVIVSRSVAQRFADMGLGDHPHLGKGLWTIVGLFDAQGTAFDSEMWMDTRELMDEFDRTNYNTVVLRAESAAAAANFKTLADADARIKLDTKTEAKYYEEQTSSALPIKIFGVFLAVIMSIGACFAGMNTMYASVASRVREIGTLRVLGFKPRQILISFQIESIVLALAGGLIGCLLSLPINGLATGTTNFSTFSEIVFYFTITPDLMLKGLGFAVVMGAVGGFLPALSASRQPILQSLRQA